MSVADDKKSVVTNSTHVRKVKTYDSINESASREEDGEDGSPKHRLKLNQILPMTESDNSSS